MSRVSKLARLHLAHLLYTIFGIFFYWFKQVFCWEWILFKNANVFFWHNGRSSNSGLKLGQSFQLLQQASYTLLPNLPSMPHHSGINADIFKKYQDHWYTDLMKDTRVFTYCWASLYIWTKFIKKCKRVDFECSICILLYRMSLMYACTGCRSKKTKAIQIAKYKIQPGYNCG